MTIDKKEVNKRVNSKLNSSMLAAADVIKTICQYRFDTGICCKGCNFNKLVYQKGEYDDFEWTDNDDKYENNLTYCDLYFGNRTAPRDWEL